MLTPPPLPTADEIPPCPVPLETRNRDDRGRLLPGHTLGGRPFGPNRATVILQGLFEEGAGDIGRRILLAVKGGDMAAARIAMDRLYPVRRGTPVEIANFPKITTAADVPIALAALLDAVTAGALTAEEAKPISDLLSAFVAALEATALEERLAALEALQEGAAARRGR